MSNRMTATWDGGLRFVHGGFFLLTLLLFAWHRYPDLQGALSTGGSGFFYLLSGLGGILTGFYYQIVVRTAYRGESGPPALFYAYDLFGAAIGGMLGGLLIFPMAGG